MLEQVHSQITSELNQNTRTDTIFILSAIILNLISLAVNSGMADNSRQDNSNLIVMYLFVFLIIIVNAVVIIGLLKGKQTRMKLASGLMRMYKDHDVDKYYDETLLTNYNIRYVLFILVVVCTGVIAISVPFILR